ncbi:phage terminase small subunit P27 family [Fructobacillus sp. CRL 2054]|uniref:phage terminase small subunit P27 family n=1 Tax=Fructobacillus sp. CRL 2054 TaxID=2763007 RepID=UPI002379D687|nr:phage terminase small subunit P27 family [Fructobacillus sp. CRL 2054]MDD9138322.1 phage terminase small subunit P27 family [Fructobacillus sp. CRL 2054]
MTENKRKRYTKNGLSQDPPAYMSVQAKTTWRQIVSALGEIKELKKSDAKLIEMYCTQYELYRNAYKHIQENGEVQPIYDTVQNNLGEAIGKDFKGFKRNPMTSIYNDAIKSLNNISRELGLTPKSRKELFDAIDKGDGESVAAIKKLFG